MGRGASGHQSSRGDLGHCLAGCRYPSTTCGCLPASAPIPPQLKQIACMQSTTTHLGQVVAEQLRHLERHGRLHAAQHGRLERLCRVVKMSTKRRLEGVLFAGQQAVGMATRALVGAGHPAFRRCSRACSPHSVHRRAPRGAQGTARGEAQQCHLLLPWLHFHQDGNKACYKKKDGLDSSVNNESTPNRMATMRAR